MKSHFGIKLMVTLTLFALVLTCTIATADHLRLRSQVKKNFADQMVYVESNVVNALQTVDKAYYLFGQELGQAMEEASHDLIRLYEKQRDFSQWDFALLREQFGFDIYVINEANVIEYSSFPEDIGLDFNACCSKLAKVLDDIRYSGAFHHDGIDMEQQTGYLKKYSYAPTRDRKYLIQLGYELQEDGIFVNYSFFDVIDDLLAQYTMINEMNILNIGGYALGSPVTESGKLSPERRSAFERALAEMRTTEIGGEWNGIPVTYRYVHYTSPFDQGTTQSKIVEIVYNDHELQQALRQIKRSFIYRLLVVHVVAILLSIGLSKWLSRPMYLAFHDSLTGLKNRAAFDEQLDSVLKARTGNAALLLIDLDDFKLVNDNFGHDQGDVVLREVARILGGIAGKSHSAFRIGGDEFAMLLPSASAGDGEQMAQAIIHGISQRFDERVHCSGPKMTVSIGIAYASKEGLDTETWCKQADVALYASKKEGKNKYRVFG